VFGYESYYRDREYMVAIKDTLLDSGVESFLFTSDGILLSGDSGSLRDGKSAGSTILSIYF